MKYLALLLLAGCAGHQWETLQTAPCHGSPVRHVVADVENRCHQKADACVIRTYNPKYGLREYQCEIVSPYSESIAKGMPTWDFGVSLYDHELRLWAGFNHL